MKSQTAGSHKRVLGKGLSNLLGDSAENLVYKAEQGIMDIELDRIVTNEDNPRKHFNQTAIKELANTIREHGLLQPILVYAQTQKTYQVISGERRLRACRSLNLKTIPCIIKDLSQQKILEVSLIENIQREQLDALEEAHVYNKLMEIYKLTQEEVALRVGKERSTITNKLRLLKLPIELQTAIADRRLTEGQIRPILGIKKAKDQKFIAKKIIQDALSARQVEKLVKQYNQTDTIPPKNNNNDINRYTNSMVQALQEKLQTTISIQHNTAKGKGSIKIDYHDLDDFERIWGKLNQPL